MSRGAKKAMDEAIMKEDSEHGHAGKWSIVTMTYLAISLVSLEKEVRRLT